MKSLFISDIQAAEFKRGKDKKKRRKKPSYGWNPKNADLKRGDVLIKAAMLPVAGALLGSSTGRRLAKQYIPKNQSALSKGLQLSAAGTVGAIAGQKALGKVNRHTLNTEGYFTPESKLKKYRTKRYGLL